jgi:hypothetical protein
MLRNLCLIAVLAAGVARGDDVALVRMGDVWRLFKGRSEASTPPEAWRGTAFNDAAWPAGPSGFGLDSSSYLATVIGESVRDYTSLFFRRQFVVGRPQDIAWLILRVDYSGGFVAYLNGTEIARRSLPGGPGVTVPYNTLADAHLRGQPEEIDLSGFTSLLAPGTNTLAIQWHLSLPAPVGAGIVAELLGNFIRGPFLQNSSTNQQTIMWKSAVPCDTVVEFGPTPELGERYVDAALVTNHLATLTGLAPATTYHYRVSGAAGNQTGVSPVATFRTFRTSGPVRFAFAADVGLPTSGQLQVAQRLRDGDPDFVLIGGDLIYPQWGAQYEDLRLFSAYAPQMRSTPYFVVAGNHDVVYGIESQFWDAFSPPTNSVDPAVHALARTSPKHYYSFDQGDAHLVGLFAPLQEGRFSLTNGSPQALWLEADLAASAKPWKILFLHLPLHSSGPHAHDDYNHNGVYDQVEIANLLMPLARRYGVQLILAAHDHEYERFNPIDGVNLVVSGGGGGFLYGLVNPDPASAQFWVRYHCVKVAIDGDSMRLDAVADIGVVFDSIFIRRAPPPREVYPAGWNTPVIEAGPATDGDGNIAGQKFDFTGAPIPTMPGDFSNLGRVYVNHDHTHLYVGFEQVMFHSGHNVFLFLDSPGRAGVAGMAGLGNGVMDPQGEGADGLDFLENLSFTNFTPSVACVLGDEFADGQFRSFLRTNITGSMGLTTVRTNLALDIGQGVFRLDPGFSDVPGARLQQFNRSASLTTLAGEQNANFIEIAIPLSELGLKGGDRLKLGAVVGLTGFNTNADQQTRELDRGFLGYGLLSTGEGRWALEGLEVQLGPDLDKDGDGLVLADELRLGTDPNNPDTDGDGLPDGWEAKYSLNPLSAVGIDGAAGDPDGDGYTNLEELRAGTNPRLRDPPMRAGAEALANGGVRIWWSSIPGSRYHLQYTDSVIVPFTDLPAPGWPREATTTREIYEDGADGATRPQARFYRVRRLP